MVRIFQKPGQWPDHWLEYHILGKRIIALIHLQIKTIGVIFFVPGHQGAIIRWNPLEKVQFCAVAI